MQRNAIIFFALLSQLLAIALAVALLTSCSVLPAPESPVTPPPEFRVGISGPGAALEWSPGWLFGFGVGLKFYLVTPGGGEIAKPANLFPEITK